MAQILVRGLDAKTVDRLKARAKRHGRSLQGEVKLILQDAAGYSGEEVMRIVQEWQRKFGGRRFSDSAELIREDRER